MYPRPVGKVNDPVGKGITKDGLHFVRLATLLWCVLVAACGPAPAPVDSIARAPYYQAPALLERAWRLPVAKTYPNPIEYQGNGAFCGPATLVNLFRSLGIDRYDQESLFDRAEVSRWKARFRGMTLDELAGLIRSNADLEVAVLRDLTREAFRAHLQRMNDPTNRYLINFNRYPLFGVDIGHFSPLGGYLADSDLVFVLDVLDDYKPYFSARRPVVRGNGYCRLGNWQKTRTAACACCPSCRSRHTGHAAGEGALAGAKIGRSDRNKTSGRTAEDRWETRCRHRPPPRRRRTDYGSPNGPLNRA